MIRIEFSHRLIELEDSLFRFALSLTLNEIDAQDLVQDTFLKSLMYKDQFEENTNLRAWTFTIMKNTFINNYKIKRKKATAFSHNVNEFVINNRTDELTPESAYSHGEIKRQIDRLNPEYRIPFQMLNSGYNYQEIAKTLTLKLGTVKSRIFFSRKKLKDQLKEYQ